MQIVIEMTEDDYKKVQYGYAPVAVMRNAIRKGIPLPKGHGRLIDADALKTSYGLEGATKYGNESKEQIDHSYSTMMMYEIVDMLDYAPTIIEADEEEKK